MFHKPPAKVSANLPIYEAKLLTIFQMAVKETICCIKQFIDSFIKIEVGVLLKMSVAIILWCIKSLSRLRMVVLWSWP